MTSKSGARVHDVDVLAGAIAALARSWAAVNPLVGQGILPLRRRPVCGRIGEAERRDHMLRILGVVLSTLGWLLLYANAVHFEIVTDVKELPRIKRLIFWLRGKRTFFDRDQSTDLILEKEKGIPLKKHWRTEITPKVIGIALVLVGAALSIFSGCRLF